jgi:hypothetical protein
VATERSEWRLSEWNDAYAKDKKPMTAEEIDDAVAYLRDHNYPKPIDCLEGQCSRFRPACVLDVCHIAVGMCGD